MNFDFIFRFAQLESFVWDTTQYAARVGKQLLKWAWPWGVIVLVLFVFGLLFEIMRVLVIEQSPWIIHHSKAVATTYNVFGFTVDAAITIIEGIVTTVENIVIAAEDILGAQKPFKRYNVVKFTKVSAQEIANFFNVISHKCTAYDTPWDIAKGSITNLYAYDTCRVLRVFYPTPARRLLAPFLEWVGGTAYNPSAGNCEELPPVMPWFCLPFGTGIIILEVVVPVCGVIALLIASWKAYKLEQSEDNIDLLKKEAAAVSEKLDVLQANVSSQKMKAL